MAMDCDMANNDAVHLIHTARKFVAGSHEGLRSAGPVWRVSLRRDAPKDPHKRFNVAVSSFPDSHLLMISGTEESRPDRGPEHVR